MHFIVECPLENEDENLELFKIIFEQEKLKIPRDSEGWTPLHMTVDNDESKICEFLTGKDNFFSILYYNLIL